MSYKWGKEIVNFKKQEWLQIQLIYMKINWEIFMNIIHKDQHSGMVLKLLILILWKISKVILYRYNMILLKLKKIQ